MIYRKVLVLITAIVAFVLFIPFNFKGGIGLSESMSYIRYLLAFVLAVPVIVYAIRKYRKTCSRFYLLPCFYVVLGLLMVSMLSIMEMPNLNSQNVASYAQENKNSYAIDSMLIQSKDSYIQLVNSNYFGNEKRFFYKKFEVKNNVIK
jgi:hypothetical protein